MSISSVSPPPAGPPNAGRLRIACLVAAASLSGLVLMSANVVLPSSELARDALPPLSAKEAARAVQAHHRDIRALERRLQRLEASLAARNISLLRSVTEVSEDTEAATDKALPGPPRHDQQTAADGGLLFYGAGNETVMLPASAFRRVPHTQRRGALAFDLCSQKPQVTLAGKRLEKSDVEFFQVVGNIKLRTGSQCLLAYPYDHFDLSGEALDSSSGKRPLIDEVYWEIDDGTLPYRVRGRYWEDGLATPVPPIPLVPAPTPDASAGKKVAPDGRPVVAYAITVTKDGPYIDGAAVMGHSILSVHRRSKFAVELVALLKPTCTRTKRQLAALRSAGQEWRVIERGLPIDVSRTPPAYQENVKGGCCGADELIKLFAWTLTEYHRVAHLDADTLLLQNIDDVLSRDAFLVYTIDWGMMNAASRKPPVQGGFLIVRPDLDVFRELQTYAQRGRFLIDGSGWEQSHVGHYWGGSTIQGLLAFFFMVVHPKWGYAEDHCTLNAQVDDPYRREPELHRRKICMDGSVSCPDCRETPFVRVRHAHYTICQKPWVCQELPDGHLCAQLHQAWFDTRREMEQEQMRTYPNSTRYAPERACNQQFQRRNGMCRCGGPAEYVPVPLHVD